MEWRIVTTEEKIVPPIDDTTQTIIRLRGKGRTYYNWEDRSMLEIYDDFCIPIFQEPTTDFNFQCHFLNVGEKVYLMFQQDLHVVYSLRISIHQNLHLQLIINYLIIQL